MMPKVACVTTTINVPEVLRLYHVCSPTTVFFAAGDLKTPEPQCADLVNSLGADAWYISVERQKSLGYKCSELLGWNTLARRNIATLEALKFGADIIVMIDDDNIPIELSYFDTHVSSLTCRHSGLLATGVEGWFDLGKLLCPASPHRGFPHHLQGGTRLSGVVGAKVGVSAGCCLGDPDISAVTRISSPVTVHNVSRILDGGIVVDPNTKTVFNSQNTAFIRELAPAMFMMPGVGRYDDIYASLICQRVMRERDLHVRFGHPFVWQERNHHNLLSDLRAEIDGMENIVGFAEFLDTLPLEKLSVIEAVHFIYKADDKYLPTKAVMAALAFLDDVEKIL